jgi:sirohydrochlorin cobaltochelatase
MVPANDLCAGALILVGGHESGGGRELPPLQLRDQGPLAGVRSRVATPGRSLELALAASLGESDAERPTVVLPMTLGRDPRLVGDTARTVRWAGRDGHARRLAIAPPFGTADHLVGWLRAACRGLGDDPGTAILIAAPASDPFDDAELHRVAALVHAHSDRRILEVGLRAPSGELYDGVDRCRRLGARRVAIVPAEFHERADVVAPLLSPAVIGSVIAERVQTACHRLRAHGDDGVAVALAADHQHGFGHSHGERHDHDHSHDHGQAAVG